MTLYECRGDEVKLNEAKRTNGTSCSSTDWLHAQCNTIAATWYVGSEVSVTIVLYYFFFPLLYIFPLVCILSSYFI